MLVLRLVGSVGANDHDKGRKIKLIRPHFDEVLIASRGRPGNDPKRQFGSR